MRTSSYVLTIICLLIIAMTKGKTVDNAFVSFLLTLIVVVISAFTVSALLRNIKSLILSRNYAISGIVGVVVGFVFYSWVSMHLDNLVTWLTNYGHLTLLGLIFLSVSILYFISPKKKQEEKATVEEKPLPKAPEEKKEIDPNAATEV